MPRVNGSYSQPKAKTLEELMLKRQTLKANIANMEFNLRSEKRSLEDLENEIKEREIIHKKYYGEGK